jgi:hypothetical protein
VSSVLNRNMGFDPHAGSSVVGFGFQGLTASAPIIDSMAPAGALLFRDVYLSPATGYWVGVRLNPRPTWLDRVLLRVQELATLPPGWDGQRAHIIDHRSLTKAWGFASSLAPHVQVAPSMVPTVSGGVALEWHRGRTDIEVEFSPSGETTVALEEEAGESFEGPLDQWIGQFVIAVTNLR